MGDSVLQNIPSGYWEGELSPRRIGQLLATSPSRAFATSMLRVSFYRDISYFHLGNF